MFDEENREFQPTIGHKLLIEFASNGICKSIPAGDDEPWTFKLYGITKGITQLVFKIAGSDGKIHVEFLPIYVKVE